MQVLGGGSNFAGGVPITCVPSTAFLVTLAAMKAAKTPVYGIPVKFTFSNNLEVSQCETDDPVDGFIEDLMQDAYYTYLLTVRAYHFTDKDGNRKQITAYMTLLYSGSVALQDKVVAHADSYAARTVKADNTYGDGGVVSINTSTTKCDVLF